MRPRGPGTQVQVMEGRFGSMATITAGRGRSGGEGPRGFQRGPADRRALERVVSGRKHLEQLHERRLLVLGHATRSGRGPTRPVGALSRRSCARSDQRCGPASRLACRRTPAPRRRHPSRCIRRPAGQVVAHCRSPHWPPGPACRLPEPRWFPRGERCGPERHPPGLRDGGIPGVGRRTGGARHAALAPCPRVLGGGQVSDAPGRRLESRADQGFGQRPAPPTRPSARAVEIPGVDAGLAGRGHARRTRWPAGLSRRIRNRSGQGRSQCGPGHEDSDGGGGQSGTPRRARVGCAAGDDGALQVDKDSVRSGGT